MSSDQPKRYIDREGVDEEETSEVIINDEAKNYRKQVEQVREEMSMINERYSELEKEDREMKDKLDKNNKFLERYDLVLHNILTKISKEERKKIFTDKKIIDEFTSLNNLGKEKSVKNSP